MNIMIFKTSVQDKEDLPIVRPLMNLLFGEKNWTFAFEDEDKILRVVSSIPCGPVIEEIFRQRGFACEEMHYSLSEFNV
ncbi:MAG: hypothetical protein V4687_01530 [Bacteroidota bacterium]